MYTIGAVEGVEQKPRKKNIKLIYRGEPMEQFKTVLQELEDTEKNFINSINKLLEEQDN